jgi:hypothetical protein
MRIKLPVRRVVDLQRLLIALGDVNATVNPVARGNTFRRRLDKATDEELERFLRGVKRLAKSRPTFRPTTAFRRARPIRSTCWPWSRPVSNWSGRS